MNQTDLNKGMDGRDALDDKVTALLSALPRVEAPGNFEFGVRAKIAVGPAPEPRWGLVPLLKLTAPFALLFVITAFVFFYRTNAPINVQTVAGGPGQTETPATTAPEVARDVPAVVPEQSSDESKDQQSAALMQPREEPARVANIRRQRNSRNRSVDNTPPGGGSRDMGLGSANTILPPGFDSANPNRATNANAAARDTQVPVRTVLEILGLTVEFAGATCKVNSVQENSLAARAGMKTGDVVETIDGRAVNANTKLKGDDAVKSFGVRRDGKRLTLKIGN